MDSKINAQQGERGSHRKTLPIKVVLQDGGCPRGAQVLIQQVLSDAGIKELSGLLGRHGTAEIIALSFVASMTLQKTQLIAGFYPLRDYPVL
jgi:hypothetical protein